MKTFRLAAALCAASLLAACAPPPMPLSEVKAALAKANVEVQVAHTQKTVHVVTRGEALGSNIASSTASSGSVAGALMGAALGVTIIAATKEAEIPLSDGASPAVAELMKKKLQHFPPQAEHSYVIDLGDRFFLEQPTMAKEEYALHYLIGMEVKDASTSRILLTKFCADEDAGQLTLEKWRASAPTIEGIRSKAVARCAGEFTTILAP